MRYLSTRGSCPAVDFAGALLGGVAPDGGLYVPEEWPSVDVHPSVERYTDVAVEVLGPYVAPDLGREELQALVEEAYATFDHEEVCPVRPLEDGLWLLELYWGPTLAFKDVALQLVGRLFDRELARRDERATVLVATSGDTGSSAIEACRGRDRLDIVVLHPAGRVSEVQRRQMTTVDAPNVHNVAVDGDFDDCQDLVKACFADAALRSDLRLTAMNSINWARVMSQVVYYVTAAAQVAPDGPVSFAVPTGNFGNVLAGWVAAQGGVDVDRFIVGTNRNDILARWIDRGVMEMEGVEPTLSPSMDIQVSSNVERYLWELYGRTGAVVAEAMAELRSTGRLDIGQARLDRVRGSFSASRVDDDATRAEIRRVHESTGRLIDPHTAVGVAAARAVPADPDIPRVVLATAHPAKFPDAVEQATGIRPPLPEHLADLLDRPERSDSLAADPATLADYLRATVPT
ncbi:MAG: threonine synthase [Iamia sp.]